MNGCLPPKLKTKAFMSKENKMNEILKEKDWCAAEGEKTHCIFYMKQKYKVRVLKSQSIQPLKIRN